ncbi:MAG TPA: cupin domain-containing protein [Xanthobacteraceae bacterium]|nr:cupin domain-containing protein [Xanthobacteraceae bacterium]
MSRRSGWAIASATLVCLLCQAPAQGQSNGTVTVVRPEEVNWGNPLGKGVSIATLHGDPTKPGLFVQLVRFPPHVFDRPHFHNQARHVTVIRGTWYVGFGKDFDPAKAVPLKPGSYVFQPAKMVHWDGAKDEEVIIQVIGNGPGGSTLVDKTQPFLVRADE